MVKGVDVRTRNRRQKSRKVKEVLDFIKSGCSGWDDARNAAKAAKCLSSGRKKERRDF